MKNYFSLRNPKAGWENVAQGGVDVRKLPVYPAGMLMEPYVQVLAAELTQCIAQALDKPAVASLELATS